MSSGNGTAGARPRVSDMDRAREILANWVFLWPEPEDATPACRTELGLNTAAYHVASLGRLVRDGSYIVVAKDTDAGVLAANQVAEQIGRNRATALVWKLPGYGSEYPDLTTWMQHNRLDLVVLIEEPWRPTESEPSAAGGPSPNETHGESLLRLARSLDLFRTPDGDAYATITVKGRQEHHPVVSEPVADWLLHGFFKESGKAPSADALINGIKILCARARFEEGIQSHAVALRVGADPVSPPGEPSYYLDLGDDARNAVRITPLGWKVVTEVPVRFRRPRGLAALPVPERGGDLDQLWNFINVASDEDRLLVLASLTADYLPHGPYPVKVISGEAGSAKSTTTRLFKRLVDPRAPMLGSTPKDVRDLMVIAKSTWVLTFDNLSAIPVWLSDALARLSTGGGFSTRKLHSDDEEMFFEATRPIVLNSIEDIANRADLLDRAIVITCPAIPEILRRQEREFWAAFDLAYPKILGALLDVVCGGLAMLPAVRIARPPRMADFARWGEAVCQFLGHAEGAFMDAYMGNREAAAASILEDSPIAATLIEFRRVGDIWTGTTQELLDQLRDRAPAQIRDSPRWPKVPRTLSAHLRRIAPALRKIGIDVVFPETRNSNRTFSIVWVRPEPTANPRTQNVASFASSPSSEAENGPPENGSQDQGSQGVPF